MKTSVNYRDNYGAAELKSFYGRNLTIGLLISLGVHLVFIGFYMLGDDHDQVRPPHVTLAELARPRTDTLVTIAIAAAPKDKRPGREGGGSPDVDLPPGRASKGHRDARPDKTHDRPDKDRKVVADMADKMKPVDKVPERPSVAGDTRDTSKQTGVVGTRGQHLRGTGDTDAGGSGGVGIGFATGMGRRGWKVPPRASYPQGTNATGDVVLSFTVQPNGDITNVTAVKRSSNEALVNAAIAGLRRAKARPLDPDVDQVQQKATISFKFKLQ